MNALSMQAIEFGQVEYRTSGNRTLLADLNLAIANGELLMLLGPSGSGKTTTLKLINGLLTASAGRVLVEGRSVAAYWLCHPGSRLVSSLHRRKERGAGAPIGTLAGGENPQTCAGSPADGGLAGRGVCNPLPGRAFRRTAPARRPGTCAGGRSAHPADG